METFADNLARFELIGSRELPLPKDLALWALAHLREAGQVRRVSFDLPVAIAKPIRDELIRSAGAKLGVARPAACARVLQGEAVALRRTWSVTRDYEIDRATVRGELHAANAWLALPESARTFERILTKTP